MPAFEKFPTFFHELYKQVLVTSKSLANLGKSEEGDAVETHPLLLLIPRRWLCHACLSRVTKPLSTVEHYRSFTNVSPVDGVQQLVDVLDAPKDLKADAIRVLHTFISGVASHCCAARMPEKQLLELDFTHALVGETATRSRVPLMLTLDRTIRWRSHVQDGSIVIETPGFCTMPLDGVKECYDRVKALWDESGVSEDQGSQREKLAWEYWLEHKMEFKHTKLFRVVESLTCLRSIRLAPTYILERFFMGLLCVNERGGISSMMFKTNKAGKTEVFGKVVCMNVGVDSQYKYDYGFDIFVESIVKKPSQLKYALKLSHSQVSFGLFCYGLRSTEHGYEAACGCDPAILAKVFNPAKPEELGGALHGYDWQMTDKTWQLTGDTGRIIWHCKD